MIRFSLFLLVTVGLAYGFITISKLEGTVRFEAYGMLFEPSLGTVFILSILVVLAIILLWSIISWIWNLPGFMARRHREKRNEKGVSALSAGLVAVQAGDAKLAEKASKVAGRFSSNLPATKLLQAQVAELKGDTIGVREAYGKMLAEPQTRLLGYRGLYKEAYKDGDVSLARQIIEEASEFAPGTEWSSQALLTAQTQENDWVGALQTAQRNADNHLIDRASSRRQRAVLLVAQAMEIKDSDPKQAKKMALEAHRIVQSFVPASLLTARLMADEGSISQAVKVLKATWKYQPHPDIGEMVAFIQPGDSAIQRLKRVKSLVGKNPQVPDGAMLLGKAAIDAQDWDLARSSMELIPDAQKTQKACEIVAELEFGQHEDRGLEREWMARALKAPKDPTWVADGYVSDTWAPVSPISGRLDAFEWRVPVESLSYDAEAVGVAVDASEQNILDLQAEDQTETADQKAAS